MNEKELMKNFFFLISFRFQKSQELDRIVEKNLIYEELDRKIFYFIFFANTVFIFFFFYIFFVSN